MLPLFTHYIHKSTSELHEYLKEWMETHHSFVEKVRSCILNCKGLTKDDYILMISQTGQPLDEIGIVLMARLYHIHVAIVQEK